MSKLIAEYLQHPLSASANIALLDDGNVGGVLGATLGSKLDVSAYEQPGLELITSESFSAVSTVSVDGCFSAAYLNYRILINITSLPDALSFRLRVGGSDNSAANYETAVIRIVTSTADGFTSTGGTSWFPISNVAGATTGRASFDVFAPFPAAPTNGLGHYSHYNANANAGLVSLHHTTSTSFDGFTIFPASSTITGNLRVYGYKD